MLLKRLLLEFIYIWIFTYNNIVNIFSLPMWFQHFLPFHRIQSLVLPSEKQGIRIQSLCPARQNVKKGTTKDCFSSHHHLQHHHHHPPDRAQPPCYCPWWCSVCEQSSARCSQQTPLGWSPGRDWKLLNFVEYVLLCTVDIHLPLRHLLTDQFYLHQVVCLQVNCSSGLVQHKHLRLPQQGPGQRQQVQWNDHVWKFHCFHLAKQISCLWPTLRLVPPSETMCWSPSGKAATKVRRCACSRALHTWKLWCMAIFIVNIPKPQCQSGSRMDQGSTALSQKIGLDPERIVSSNCIIVRKFL